MLSASRETERLMRSKKLTKTPRASRNAMRHRLCGTLETLGSDRGKEAPKKSEYQNRRSAARAVPATLGLAAILRMPPAASG
jgi:hypothetical protein